MKELPILFSAPMIRAILEGRKTQTRRVVKQPWPTGSGSFRIDNGFKGGHPVMVESKPTSYPGSCEILWLRRWPYGQPGDRLWVRETWAHVPASAYRCSDGVLQTACPSDPDMAAVYAADWDRSRPGRWRPSIHMPRWASRITLEVTGVRVERLQDISEADARAEGAIGAIDSSIGNNWCAREAFAALWESINGPGSWDANPWVWVVEFARIDSASAAA